MFKGVYLRASWRSLAVITATSIILAACSQAPAPTAVPKPAATEAPKPTTAPAASDPATTLVIAIDADPVNLEPGTNLATPVGSELIMNVFDTLVGWKAPEFKELEGRLAQSWALSDDKTTYTFKLRGGVKFHDGTDFNADAVKKGFERIKDVNSFMKAYFGGIKEIKAVDAGTVVITLDKPNGVFLSYLAMPQAAIGSPAAVDKYGKAINVNPVGTGPFMFESYTQDTQTVLKANPNYFRGAPKIQKIIYRVIPNAATRRLELENGTVDIVQQNGQLFSIPVNDIKALKQNANVDVIELPSQIIRYIQFNNSKTDGPIADKRVRQAIATAIDYDGMVNDLLGGTANKMYGPLTDNSWGWNPAMKDAAPKRDVAKAKALLKEAGYGEGGKPLELTLYTFTGQSWKDLGTFIQANLADVGVTAKIEQLDFSSALRPLHTEGKHDLAIGGRQPWYNDPEAHITIDYLSTLGPTALTFRMAKDDALDKAILDAQTEQDFAKRKQMYFDLQTKILDKAPGAYLFNPKIIIYKRKNVQGLVVNSAPPLSEYWSVSKTK